MSSQFSDILKALAPHSILVGSASRRDQFRDIDLVINDKGLQIARELFPSGWTSVFIGHIKTFDTDCPIEVFRYWYGPEYETLARRKRQLTTRKLFDVEFRAWPIEDWEKAR